MAAAAPILSLIAGTIALVGLLGAFLGILTPIQGFQIFVAGALLGGLASVIVSLVGIVITRGGHDPAGRTRALVGLALGLGLLLVILGAAANGGSAPPINDITTDLESPPQFASATDVPEYGDRDMSFPPEFVDIVRAAYPDLDTLRVAAPPATTWQRALEAAESLGWEIVAQDEMRGVFDARDETRIFHFVDDVTVRIVADGAGSLVDVRSKSRDGRGDLGANAARIRKFLAELE